MATDDKIRDKKLQCNIDRETAKITALNIMNILQEKKYYSLIEYK